MGWNQSLVGARAVRSAACMSSCAVLVSLLANVGFPGEAVAQTATKWATVWAASVQGPYPVGNPAAQPNLRFALPEPRAGARDQTFRLIVNPSAFGSEARLRFSNAFGTKPVTLDDVRIAGHKGGGAVPMVPGPAVVRFGGRMAVTIEPGHDVWSDPVSVRHLEALALTGVRLAVSFHVVGESGPLTWHAKALATSYISAPGSGSHSEDPDGAAFPFTTTSWFLLDAIDMRVPASMPVIVAFGDSITDGTASTLNGDDRWPDVLARRLNATANSASVVNAGIGGNQVLAPATYSATNPVPGGPSAEQRLERDVLALSGVSAVIWLEGINDLSKLSNATADQVAAGMRRVVERIRARFPGVVIVGATAPSALHSTNAAHGTPEQDAERRKLNVFIRTSGLFDHVADFDAATLDEVTGELRAEFVPDSTTGGPGDKLHPNRAGYAAMARSIDPAWFRRPTSVPASAPGTR